MCVPYRCERPVGATVKECASWWCSGGSELVSLKDVRRDPDVWRSKYLPSGDKLASVSQSARQIIYDGGLACNLFFFFPCRQSCFPLPLAVFIQPPKVMLSERCFLEKHERGACEKRSDNLATLTRPLIRDAGGKKKSQDALNCVTA